jgi:hypothetical protein
VKLPLNDDLLLLADIPPLQLAERMRLCAAAMLHFNPYSEDSHRIVVRIGVGPDGFLRSRAWHEKTSPDMDFDGERHEIMQAMLFPRPVHRSRVEDHPAGINVITLMASHARSDPMSSHELLQLSEFYANARDRALATYYFRPLAD